MMNVAVNSLPESIVNLPAKTGSDRAERKNYGPEFDDLLNPREGPESDNPLREPSASKTSRAESPTAEVDDEGRDERADSDEDNKGAVDANVLSAQLALWQILPRPVDPVVPSQENIAALEAPLLPAEPTTATSMATGEKNSALGTKPASLAQELPPTAAANALAAPVGSAADQLTNKASQEVAAVTPKEPAGSNGIPVAKQHRVMTDRDLTPAETPVTAGIADPTAGTNSIVAAAPSASGSGQNFQESQGGNREGQLDAALAGNAVPISETRAHQAPEAPEAPAAVHAADATKVIDQIERALERMRTQGNQRIELRLPLQDGGEVVVKLQIEAGQVSALFRTDSQGLREALESRWTQFTTTSSERVLKVGSAVFESASMENTTGGFSQSPDQRNREQAFAEAERSANAGPSIPFGSKATPDPRRMPVAPASAAGLQLYA